MSKVNYEEMTNKELQALIDDFELTLEAKNPSKPTKAELVATLTKFKREQDVLNGNVDEEENDELVNDSNSGSEGEITVASYVPYKQRKKYVSNIGVVLGQKSQLVWDLPVRDGYELIRHIYKISKEDYEKRLDEFIEMLDMKEFINQPVRQLSLGQKMRAEIVATMLHNPKIIFLDEPTIGLDLVAKKKIQDFIRTINKKPINLIFVLILFFFI